MCTLKTITEFGSVIRKVAGLSNIAENEIEKLIKRIQIYEYSAHKFPMYIDEKRAQEIVYIRDNTTELARCLRYHADIDFERKIEEEMKKKSQYESNLFYDKKKELYDKGMNVYGPGMMNLYTSYKYGHKSINHHHTGKLYSNIKLNEYPQIVFDLSQIWTDDKVTIVKTIGQQLQTIYSTNRLSRDPWQLHFVGYNSDSYQSKYFRNTLVTLDTTHPEQYMLPDLNKKLPHEYIPKDKKVVYLSLRSKKMLEGPVDADYYVINANKDQKKESLIMGMRAGVETYAIPIRKYIKWQGGPLYLPYLNTVNILKQVYRNGGDWKTALYDNISKRFTQSNYHEIEINRSKRRLVKIRDQELNEITELMDSI